jgi:hypothetical protein
LEAASAEGTLLGKESNDFRWPAKLQGPDPPRPPDREASNAGSVYRPRASMPLMITLARMARSRISFLSAENSGSMVKKPGENHHYGALPRRGGQALHHVLDGVQRTEGQRIAAGHGADARHDVGPQPR